MDAQTSCFSQESFYKLCFFFYVSPYFVDLGDWLRSNHQSLNSPTVTHLPSDSSHLTYLNSPTSGDRHTRHRHTTYHNACLPSGIGPYMLMPTFLCLLTYLWLAGWVYGGTRACLPSFYPTTIIYVMKW